MVPGGCQTPMAIVIEGDTGLQPAVALARTLALLRVNSWEAARLPVPRELAHGNQGSAANAGVSRPTPMLRWKRATAQ